MRGFQKRLRRLEDLKRGAGRKQHEPYTPEERAGLRQILRDQIERARSQNPGSEEQDPSMNPSTLSARVEDVKARLREKAGY